MPIGMSTCLLLLELFSSAPDGAMRLFISIFISTGVDMVDGPK